MKRIISLVTLIIATILPTMAEQPEVKNSGLNIQVVNPRHFGNGILLDVIMQNTSFSNIEIGLSRGSAIDGNGIEYYVNWYRLARKKPTFIDLPRNTSVRGQILIEQTSEKLNNIRTLDIPLSEAKISDRGHRYREELLYRFKDIIIPSLSNTDNANTVCTHPDLYISPLNCARVDNNIEMTFLVTNKSNMTIDLDKDLKFSRVDCHINAYDEYGNWYGGSLQSPAFDKALTYILPPEVPVKLKIVVNNVPQSVKKFQLIRFKTNPGPYTIPVNFLIDFNNMNVGWTKPQESN